MTPFLEYCLTSRKCRSKDKSQFPGKNFQKNFRPQKFCTSKEDCLMKLSIQKGLAHSQTIPNPKQYLFTILKSLSIMILKNIYMQQEFKEKVVFRLRPCSL